MTANDLSQKFLKWFQSEYPEARIYRNNAGIAKRGKQIVKFGIPNSGSPDYLAFIPDHKTKTLRVDFIEIKTINDKLSIKQKQFAKLIKSIYGKYYIINELKNGEFEINEY